MGLDRAASFAFAGGVGVSQGCIADDTAGGTVFRHKTGGGRPTVGVDGFFRDIRIVGLCAVGGVCGTAEIAVAQVKTVSCREASGFTAKGAGVCINHIAVLCTGRLSNHVIILPVVTESIYICIFVRVTAS